MHAPSSQTGGFRALADAQRRLPDTRRAALPEGPVEYLTVGDGPRVVLMSGYGVPLSSWALVVDGLTTIATVLAYNRLGVGGSAAPRQAQTGAAVVDMLRRTLVAAELAAPYIVVAHAHGGLYAQLYARLHPDEVAGIALLESTHPDDDPLQRKFRFLPDAVARAGMSAATGRRSRGHAELAHIETTVAEIEQAGPFPDLPLVVVSGAKTPSRLTATRAQVDRQVKRQRELAALSSQGEQILAPNSGYLPLITDPGIVIEAVRRLIGTTDPQGLGS